MLEPRCLLTADALFSLDATSLDFASEQRSHLALDLPLQVEATNMGDWSLRHSDGPYLTESAVAKGLAAAPSTLDLGDYYWGDGQQISLRRKPDQFVVGFTAPHLADTLSAERIAEIDGLQFDGWTKVSDIVPGISIWEASSLTTSVFDREGSECVLSMFDREEVQWTSPVFIEPQSGLRLVAPNETVVALERDVDPALFFSTDTFTAYRPLLGTPDQFVATLARGGGADTLRLTSELDQLPGVVFASPNFLSEIQFQSIPNDPLFPAQWHLQNTGQWGARPGADAKLTTAWDTTTGSQEIVIAILDDGVQTNHPDLAANIWVNPYEVAGNGIDDDLNGWVDDVHGLNVTASNNNDPNPSHRLDFHGTAVAGVAAARGNNDEGVAGAAYNTKIMPLKIWTGLNFATSANIAQAIYYAAGRTADGQGTWRGADIANSSWGGAISDTTLANAFNWSATNGRGGLGLAHFVSSGNSASAYREVTVTGAIAGDWQFAWQYQKNGSVNAGEDTAWLAYVRLPNGQIERFDSPSFPAGWTTGGNSNSYWSITNDIGRAFGTGRYAAKAGITGHNQGSWIKSPVISVSSTSVLSYQLWVSSEANFDGVQLFARYNAGDFFPIGGVSYSAGFNQYYGYGRVNAAAALALVSADTAGPIVNDSAFDPTTYNVPIFTALFNERTVWTSGSITVRAPDGTTVPFEEFGSGTTGLAIALPQLPQNGVYSVVLSGVSPATAFKDQAGNRINGGQTDVVLNFTHGSTTPTGERLHFGEAPMKDGLRPIVGGAL